MKVAAVWIWALAASTMAVIAACGSGGGSIYSGSDAGSDGTMTPDVGQIMFGDGGGEGGHHGSCNKLTCKKLGFTCGPAGDGCGGLLDCGSCSAPETCGGGGKFSQCGGSAGCVPKTCADLGVGCGPAGDGCGGKLDCGSCTAPESCGGGTAHSQCGTYSPPDGGPEGGLCKPLSCADQGLKCGPAGDGCGGKLSCGGCKAPETCGGAKPGECGSGIKPCVPVNQCGKLGFNCGLIADGCGGTFDCGADSGCPTGETCGGGGKPGVCGGPTPPEGGLDGGYCVPLTCKGQGIKCGPAGDGCGDKLSCGGCPPGETCGGGGVPSVCGSGTTACKPQTCLTLGIDCGPAGDGCGGSLSCGTCAAPDICGGGGTPGKCGSSAVPPEGGYDGGFCVPQTCADQKLSCGPAGDGCGHKIKGGCGSCPPGETCGGGGTPGACGSGTVPCVPNTCAALGFNCGLTSDGCGGMLDCDSESGCPSGQACGAGGTPNVCGSSAVPPDGGYDGGFCIPLTCSDLGFNCGPAGNGCGGLIASCGTCSVSGDTCGGGGVPGVCGQYPACVPATCTDLGVTCGQAADGCGGLTAVCGTCTSPDTCGGGGVPGQCGGACTTTVTGTVYDPTGLLPLPGVEVYQPSGALITYPSTVGCDTCVSITSPYYYITSSATDGSFTLQINTTGGTTNVPIVVQSGRWRREFTVATVTSCGKTLIPSGDARMPRNHDEGTIPYTAIAMAGAESLECLLVKMGISTSGVSVSGSEFGAYPTAGASFQLFKNGTGQMTTTPASPFESSLFGTASVLDNFNAILLPCGAGGDTTSSSTNGAGNATSLGNIKAWANAGGRFFIDHIPGETIINSATTGWNGTADGALAGCTVWNSGGGCGITSPAKGLLLTTSPEATALESWMSLGTVGGTSTYGSPYFQVPTPRDDVTTVHSPAVEWARGQHNNTWGTGDYTLSYTYDTDTSGVEAFGSGCGRVVFNDMHVSATRGKLGSAFPANCDTTTALNESELALEYMLFQSTACQGPPPPPPPCAAETCATLGYTCGGPYDDSCGGKTAVCGTCVSPLTCGGGGKAGTCGGTPCVPETCATLKFTCGGPYPDGCGGSIATCGTCSPPATCGGGGTPGTCGQIDAGACTPQTCAGLGYACGTSIPDGCGGTIPSCGTCPGCETCGGGGKAGQCGGTCCVPETCSSLGISCGPAGDGCGGTLNCGTCGSPLTCGGGGTPGKCGAPDAGSCAPETCATLGYTCGTYPDGCGGTTPSCGTCSGCQTCGGGGKGGQCGGTCCVPETCKSLGFSCGPAGDGCGGTLNCGTCATPLTCGGGGTPGVCGDVDAGSSCTPQTCALLGFSCGSYPDGCGGTLDCGACSGCAVCGGGGVAGACGGTCCKKETCAGQGISCGPAGDGCGGSLDCGSCVAPMTCGGGGTPGVCGEPEGAACAPLTCAGQGIDCGPAGDGCGGSLSCGTCPKGETCGGGGMSGKCGKPMCTPKTCAQLGFNCGPAGDGCGGTLDCGKCTSPNTCGGGGAAGVCGAPTTK